MNKEKLYEWEQFLINNADLIATEDNGNKSYRFLGVQKTYKIINE